MNSQSSIPKFKVGLTPEEKSLYTQLFKSLDPENNGVVTGERARTTFEKSGLPPAVLGEIWQIADQNNLGFLNQYGFCYAMRLIGYTQAGQRPIAGLGDSPGPLPKFSGLNLATPHQQPQQMLQPQSTNSSFMSSQPNANANIPSNISPQNPIDSIAIQDYQKFSQLFIKTVGSPQGQLNGGQAKDIFLKARLPTSVLGQVWSLVDRYNTGSLNVGSFVVAMHLIQGLLSGQIKQLPPFLPESIWQSVENYGQSQQNSSQSVQNQQQSRQISQASINSQSTAIRHPPSNDTTGNDWVVTPAMKQQYDSIFDSVDKEKSGALNPDQVAQFLMTSKLNQHDLATIWDLADIQNSGIFTKLEFSIALYLVNKKLANEQLPNIIPDSLINSLKQSPPQTQSKETAKFSDKVPQKPIVQQTTKSESSLNDLAGIFNSNEAATQPEVKQLQNRQSSSDLSHGSQLPKVRSTLTGSFKPTSTFGQSLIHNKQQPSSELSSPVRKQTQDTLLGEDITPQSQQKSQEETSLNSPQKVIDYSALRNVPPPPPPQKKTSSFTPEASNSPSKATSNNLSNQTNNNDDLLADPAISGQLSQATSDIANVSNQIKSLATQTTSLHDKKTKAEQELNKILKTKSDIEGKLKQLKTSYENEVKQVSQVESSLATAKEETEALRSEASIAEAKLNSLSSELHEKQITVEDLQKENSSLKEKLGTLNAESVELEKQLDAKKSEAQQLKNQVAVKKSQTQVTIVKNEEIKSQIADLEDHHKNLQSELDNAEKERLHHEHQQKELHQRNLEVQQNKPTKPSSNITAESLGIGAAVGAAIGGVANMVSSQFGTTEEQREPSSSSELTQKSTSGGDTSKQLAKDVNKLSVNDEMRDLATNGTSSTITDQGDENETPITSPSTSDFQFPQSNNAGIAGGMVGMPGVLVGVQRTESLTSSVQNNAALSVRDDNIEEISDRDTINNVEENEIEGKEVEAVQEDKDVVAEEDQMQSSRDKHLGDSDKGSSSFEMVNSEEARSPENSEEFPPIRELDYQESDSDEGDDDSNFDDAVDNLNYHQTSTSENKEVIVDKSTAQGHPVEPQEFNDFDSEFNNLEPAKEEDEITNQRNLSQVAKPKVSNNEDFFDDEFDNLEVAKDDNEFDGEFERKDVNDDFNEFSNTFTNSNAPDFGSGPNTIGNNGNSNDEWEQLFAGFGNAETSNVQDTAHSQSTGFNNFLPEPTTQITSGGEEKIDNYAIQELVGMGFDESTAIDALKRQDWNLELATNYLLDHA